VTSPRVSIVLPTRNGAATLPAVLDGIGRQRASFAAEVIAVDSGSTDGSRELLGGRVDRLITIAADAFNHGLTRNLGIEHARGELVILLVQDAIPASDVWLTNLTAPMFADDRLAGVFARQIPRPDASPVSRHYLSRYLASRDAGRTVAVASRQEFEALPPLDRLDRCTFDNVCSCIRRSVWLDRPFPKTPIAEDVEWARDVLLSGYHLAYVPDAVVIHSHERSALDEFRRTFALHRRLYELFGVRTVPTLPLLVRAIASSLLLHRRSELNTSGAQVPSARAMSLAVVWPTAQYLGALAAAHGQRPLRIL
jgi:rhamnosyltransferase